MKWFNNLMVLATLTLCGLSVGFPAGASATSEAFRNYGQIRLGVNEFTDDMDDAGMDTGVDLGAAYGRYLTPNLVLEAAIDFFASDRDVRGYNGTAGSYDIDDTLGVMAVLATIKGEFPVGRARIFGGGGVGYYVVALNSDIDTAYLGDFDEDESDSVFGAHVVAGVNVDITKRFFAGLQGMYRWTDDIDIDERVATVPIRLEGDLSGYVVNLTAGFRF
ncbi:outer membrane beta-barrel protein [Desulfatitalea tepidiphila]|uniref:outer membrane beta-barrel protein n=1 Tax=Desulfatitalea tepidiphila TaxID=1185843 RepID=UPI00097576BA|nr:outer membrane beta-barrel protein [Desulfatitalea tepidiphila]